MTGERRRHNGVGLIITCAKPVASAHWACECGLAPTTDVSGWVSAAYRTKDNPVQPAGSPPSS
jgi:hypothetical protein